MTIPSEVLCVYRRWDKPHRPQCGRPKSEHGPLMLYHTFQPDLLAALEASLVNPKKEAL